jgi:hypothetical protein
MIVHLISYSIQVNPAKPDLYKVEGNFYDDKRSAMYKPAAASSAASEYRNSTAENRYAVPRRSDTHVELGQALPREEASNVSPETSSVFDDRS